MMSSLQEAILIHLGVPSAILEICVHALKLATLSALPVPMLRQVYVGAPRGAQNRDFARDTLPKWEDGDVMTILL